MDLGRRARLLLALPGAVRWRLVGLLHRLPRTQQRLAGTIGVTSVGMFGRGAGWGVATQVHTLDVVVGGTATEPATGNEGGGERDLLHLTLMFDHDVVDGGPAARFAARLRELLEGTDLLEGSGSEQTGRTL
jgi:hypothetical protein